MFRFATPQRLASATLLMSLFANAQSIALTASQRNPDRRSSTDTSVAVAFRDQARNPDWINYKDCAANIALRFTLSLANIPSSGSGTFRVWAGTDDCKVVANRTGDSTRTCWPVSKDLEQTQTVTVDVLAQHIVGYIAKSAAEKPQNFSELPTTSTPSLCSPTTNGLTAAGPTAVKLWFMFTDGSGNVLGTPLEWATSVDVNGPAAPTAVAVTPGDGALNLSLTVSDSANETSAEYVVYCFPTGAAIVRPDAGTDFDAGTALDSGFDGGTGASDGGASDAEAAGDAGSSTTGDASSGTSTSADASAASGSCVAPWIPEPASPLTVDFLNTIGAFECGTIGGSSRTSRVRQFSGGSRERLRNGVSYAVAVVGRDNVENIGGIKSGGCTSPIDTITFWDNYENAGGLAGGCSVGRPVLSGGYVAISALVGLAAALRLRRKGR